MLIILSRRTTISQSVTEDKLTGVAPLEAVSNNFDICYINIIFLFVFVLVR
jgi:hypothetical protein